jgi:hypothetical protein
VADVNEPVATPPGANQPDGEKFLGLKTWQLCAIGGAALFLIYMVIKGNGNTSSSTGTTAAVSAPSTDTNNQLDSLQSELTNIASELASGSGTASGSSSTVTAGSTDSGTSQSGTPQAAGTTYTASDPNGNTATSTVSQMAANAQIIGGNGDIAYGTGYAGGAPTLDPNAASERASAISSGQLTFQPGIP